MHDLSIQKWKDTIGFQFIGELSSWIIIQWNTINRHFSHSVLQCVCVCVCVYVCVCMCVCMSVTGLSVGGGCGLCVEVVLCSCVCACRLLSCVQWFIQWFCLCVSNSCGWWVWSVCVGGAVQCVCVSMQVIELCSLWLVAGVYVCASMYMQFTVL